MNPIDPFSLKQQSKLSPQRLIYTAWARWQERVANKRFAEFKLPEVLPQGLEIAPDYNREDTAVQPDQMALLVRAIHATHNLGGPLIEIGAYRGVTTQTLASISSASYFAIDPYIGYGGAESDLAVFKERTSHLTQVTHLRLTSGQASLRADLQGASFCFIDAVHDYVNVRFDGSVWGNRIANGGFLSFHDTDEIGFSGVRRAVWEQLHAPNSNWKLWAHVEGLVILQKVV